MRGLALAVALLGCRRADDDIPQPKVEPRFEPAREGTGKATPPAAVVSKAYLEGAVLEASFDTTALAEFVSTLPRPTQRDTPLVGAFAGVVDALLGDPAARLDAVGLEPNARIELSMRTMDGRAAAARKLFGELAQDGQAVASLDSSRVARLTSEARTLGVHMRASLPTRDADRLLRALSLLTMTDGDVGAWANACGGLGGSKQPLALCSARPRLMVWARVDGPDRMQVDAVYLFHDGVPPDDLARALVQADAWPARASVPEFGEPAPIELRIHAEPARELLEVEALADAVASFVAPEGTFDYAEYLHGEAALRELVPAERMFDGVDLDLHVANDRLSTHVHWLPGPHPGARGEELFAPVIERGTLPVLEGDCATAQVCARVGGFSIFPRFTDLARAAFSDSTGVARIVRQAGDGAPILLGLCSWPNLLGTIGATAQSSRGLLDQAVSSVLADSSGVGLLTLELGDDPELAQQSPLGQHFVGYLRVGPQALRGVSQLGMLTGLSLRPAELPGVEAQVERGSYEQMSIYLIDEGRFGGWVVTTDAEERVDWLLDTPREPIEPTALDPIWYLRVQSLGPLAAREQLSYVEDPPIRAWLDGRSLEVRGRFIDGYATVSFELGPAK